MTLVQWLTMIYLGRRKKKSRKVKIQGRGAEARSNLAQLISQHSSSSAAGTADRSAENENLARAELLYRRRYPENSGAVRLGGQYGL